MLFKRITVLSLISLVTSGTSVKQENDEDNFLRGAAGPKEAPSLKLPLGTLKQAIENPDTPVNLGHDHRRLSMTMTDYPDDAAVPCPKSTFLCEMDPVLSTFQCSAHEETKCDNCGSYCHAMILNVLDTLEASATPEDAMNSIAAEDLDQLVQSILGLVGEDYKPMTTPQAVVNAFFQNDQANPMLLEAGNDGNDEGRALEMCGDKCNGDGGLTEFFAEKPKGCFGATGAMVSSVLEVVFTALRLQDAGGLSTKVAWKLMMEEKNLPMISQLFYAVEKLGDLNQESDLTELAVGMSSFIMSHYGLKDVWCAMRASMTTGEIVRSSCSMLLNMVAMSVTDGAFTEEIGPIEGSLTSFSGSYTEWIEDCFGSEVESRDGEEGEGEKEEEEEEEEPECPPIEPYCNDDNLCTQDTSMCDETTTFEWICLNTPVVCEDPNESCDPADGLCKSSCPSVVPDCDDGNKCTIQGSPKCDASSNFDWVCQSEPVICANSGDSCDPIDGICKSDDQLIPCVGVIDEDDDFREWGWLSRTQTTLWREFRKEYPDRPYCLLVPNHKRGMNIPSEFLNDPKTVVHYNVNRDNGMTSKREDWVKMCGLDKYTSANVQWVGLFIDDSGSLKEKEVSKSRDLFYSELEKRGIQVRKVVNEKENWIKPFMTTLVPN